MNAFLLGLATALIGTGILWFLARNRSGKEESLRVLSTVERMRAIGRLSAYKVLTKEIVTETDHSWGPLAMRYLRWVMSERKLAMIFEFSIDFQYDLQSPLFRIERTGPDAFLVELPPCEYAVNIRNIRFYDEQAGRFFPWLLGDFFDGIGSGGFSESDKNRLIEAARNHAEGQAIELIEHVRSDVRKSAKNTIESIARAFGAKLTDFRFSEEILPSKVPVGISERLANAS